MKFKIYLLSAVVSLISVKSFSEDLSAFRHSPEIKQAICYLSTRADTAYGPNFDNIFILDFHLNGQNGRYSFAASNGARVEVNLAGSSCFNGRCRIFVMPRLLTETVVSLSQDRVIGLQLKIGDETTPVITKSFDLRGAKFSLRCEGYANRRENLLRGS